MQPAAKSFYAGPRSWQDFGNSVAPLKDEHALALKTIDEKKTRVGFSRFMRQPASILSHIAT